MDAIDEIIDKDRKYTFLVGAGVSIPPPTNLPSAGTLMREFYDRMVPAEERSHIDESVPLRFEQVVELVQKHLDKNLSFIEDFDKRSPNLLHKFLASAVMQGHNVITTNFDCMIEKALLQRCAPETIVPVITKEDFLKHSDPETEFRSGKFPLYKMHGSRKNGVTNELTTDSLITTISDIGREGITKTFAIAPHKRQAFSNLLHDRVLIVMGYSGGDEFDVSPTLCELSELTKLIWIEYEAKTSVQQMRIQSYNEESTIRQEGIQKRGSDRLFSELFHEAKKWNRHLQVCRITVDTSLFVLDYVSGRLSLPDMQKEAFPGQSKSEKYILTLDALQDISRYDVAVWIYSDVFEMESALRCAKRGLKISKKGKDIRSQIIYLMHLGRISRYNKRFRKATSFFRKAAWKCREIQEVVGRANALNEIGRNYEHQGNFKKALLCYSGASELVSYSNKYNFSIKAPFLTNVANMRNAVGEHRRALAETKAIFRETSTVRDLPGMTFSQLNIGVMLFMLAQTSYEKRYVIREAKKAVDYAVEHGDLYLKALVLTKIASLYEQLADFEASREILEETLKIYRLLNHPEGVAMALFNIGITYIGRGATAEGLEKYQEAANYFKVLDNQKLLAQINHHMAGVHFSLDEYDKAYEKESYAIEISGKANLPEKKMYQKRYLWQIRISMST